MATSNRTPSLRCSQTSGRSAKVVMNIGFRAGTVTFHVTRLGGCAKSAGGENPLITSSIR